MALTRSQENILSNAILEWQRTDSSEPSLATLLALTPTERRDVLTPFVQANRDKTTDVQARITADRTQEDTDLARAVTDSDAVLQDLDDAIVRGT